MNSAESTDVNHGGDITIKNGTIGGVPELDLFEYYKTLTIVVFLGLSIYAVFVVLFATLMVLAKKYEARKGAGQPTAPPESDMCLDCYVIEDKNTAAILEMKESSTQESEERTETTVDIVEE